ncbi:alpha/beta hydrolase [Pontivivens insulae]|uniref:HTH luxR-type domain-containing protein n=1 Tax=Pontivivens insulae TaxID=1639689 RepID=A0A2R8A6T6_9RHOB|nr:alpha/beta hydrolase [Pontivivens insulae]RED18023.1 pimeloyl-ACP methyl ester carboxylesterase [Pontivivens insulae]SPF27916.1 hypothetical protein POI8812_00211 [Pontivivens insulae]
MISRLYDAVGNGADYQPIFAAMDEFIEAELSAPTCDNHTSKAWQKLFKHHFQQVGHVFDVLTREPVETPLSYVEAQNGPAAVVERSGRIVTSNLDFSNVVGAHTDLSEHFASSDDRVRFENLASANNLDAQVVVTLNVPRRRKPVVLLIGHLPQLKNDSSEAAPLSALIVEPRWSATLGDTLARSFELTGAEVDTLRAFVETGSAQGIADSRKRSIRTVRTQLSRIFAQIGVSGQTELALFLAALAQMKPPSLPGRGSAKFDDGDVKRHVLTSRVGPIEVLDYGAPDGSPVLLIQSTHPPGLTRDLRAAFAQAGLRILAPLKPGAGQSAALKPTEGPDRVAPLCRDVLDALSIPRAVIAGQASGGLYALEFARRYPAMTSAVCLIDTGTPFESTSALLRLPPTIRRTMVPARIFPEMLLLPHRLVAANFARSAKGEATVVDYFFDGSPEDQVLTRTDPSYYGITRDIISYSFLDTDRLVRDVVRWASNWSPLLSEVAASTRLRFVHGALNRMFLVGGIEAFAASRPNCDLISIEGCGQLAVFQEPDTVAVALRQLV